MFLALQPPTTTPGFLLLKCPMFHPLFLLRAMKFVTHLRWRRRRPNHVIPAPVLCADRTVTTRNSSGCRVLYIVCILFCFIAVFVSSSLSFATTPIFSPRPAPPYSHTSFRIFSPATFQRIHLLSPVGISDCVSQTTMCSSVTNSPFTFTFRLCFLFNQVPIGRRPCLSLLSAIQPQFHFHHAFSESTALHGIWSHPLRCQRHRCSNTAERVVWHLTIRAFYVLSLNSLLQCSSTARGCFHFIVSSHSYPVGLAERPFILCRTARSLIFDLSSLTTRLLAGECSSSYALSLSSFLARFQPEDTLLHWFQRSTFK